MIIKLQQIIPQTKNFLRHSTIIPGYSDGDLVVSWHFAVLIAE